MHSSTLTSKGQVTIPAEIRHALELRPGDIIEFEAFDNKIILFKKRDDVAQAFGMYRVNKKITLAEIQKAIDEGYADGSS